MSTQTHKPTPVSWCQLSSQKVKLSSASSCQNQNMAAHSSSFRYLPQTGVWAQWSGSQQNLDLRGGKGAARAWMGVWRVAWWEWLPGLGGRWGLTDTGKEDERRETDSQRARDGHLTGIERKRKMTESELR